MQYIRVQILTPFVDRIMVMILFLPLPHSTESGSMELKPGSPEQLVDIVGVELMTYWELLGTFSSSVGSVEYLLICWQLKQLFSKNYLLLISKP